MKAQVSRLALEELLHVPFVQDSMSKPPQYFNQPISRDEAVRRMRKLSTNNNNLSAD